MNQNKSLSRVLGVLLLSALAVAVLALGTIRLPRAASQPSSAALNASPRANAPQLAASYGKLPLRFEANRGQTKPGVDFVSRGAGYTLFLNASESVLSLRNASAAAPAVVHMRLLGSNAKAAARGIDPLAGRSNYLRGNSRSKWLPGVENFAKVRYAGVYPGIDLVYYGTGRKLEYDFVVAPGADPQRIRLAVDSAGSLRLQAGDLLVGSGPGTVRLHKPRVYQQIDGARKDIEGSFALSKGEVADMQEGALARNRAKPARYPHPKTQTAHFGDPGLVARASDGARNEVTFALGAYDRSRPLIIDPVLNYSSYLGGGRDDEAAAVALDSQGNAYITGTTASLDFPVVNAAQGAAKAGEDVFVTKLDPSGSQVLYSTYIGGSGNDRAAGIAVDAEGAAYLAGSTTSNDFPLMRARSAVLSGAEDAFVTKLSPDGASFVYSTYLGGSGSDHASAIAVDRAGAAYIVGGTNSADYPLSSPLQPGCGSAADGKCSGDGFVTKLGADGATLLYSTFLGGAGADQANAVAVDAMGFAYVAGSTDSADFPLTNAAQSGCARNAAGACSLEAFVTRLAPDGASLVYSTYFGGAGSEQANAVAADAAGNAYVAGRTTSANLPVANAAQAACGEGAAAECSDAFAAAYGADGGIRFATYLGGRAADEARALAINSGGVYVAGRTASENFPVLSASQAACGKDAAGACTLDAFVTKLSLDGGALLYSTYLGGSGVDQANGLAADGAGAVVVVGRTESVDLPGSLPVGGAQRGGAEAFIAKLSDPFAQLAANNSSNVLPACSGSESKNWMGGANASAAWETAANWYPSGVPTSTDTVCVAPSYSGYTNTSPTINSAAVALSVAADVRVVLTTNSLTLGGSSNFKSGLTINGGDLVVPAGATVNIGQPGTFSWLGGRIRGTTAGAAGTCGTVNSLSGTLIDSGYAELNACTLNNSGNSELGGSGATGAYMKLYAGAQFLVNSGSTFGIFNNQKIYSDGNASNLISIASGAQLTFNPGANDFFIEPLFQNSGTMSISSGRLKLNGGSTLAGTVKINASTATLDLNGGTHAITGIIQGATVGQGALGTMEFAAGTVSVNSGATYNVAGTTLVDGADTTLNPAFTLTNIGGLQVSAGTLRLNTGAAIAPGTFTMSGGTINGGDNIVVASKLTWTGGTLGSVAGYPTPHPTITLNGGMDITGSDVYLDGRDMLCATGAVNWTANNNLRLNNGAIVTNQVVWTLNSTDHQYVTTNSGPAGRFVNSATLTKTSSTGTTHFNSVPLDNNVSPPTGAVNVTAGLLQLNGGGANLGQYSVTSGATIQFDSGTFTNSTAASIVGAGNVKFNAATSFTSNGSYQISGNTTVTGGTNIFAVNGSFSPTGPLTISGGSLELSTGSEGVSLPSLAISGGTLRGADSITVYGVINWTGGDILGGGTSRPLLNAWSALNVTGADITLDGRDLVLDGEGTTWTAANNWYLKNGATITNYGWFDASASGNQSLRGSTGGGTFINYGNFVRSGATNTTSFYQIGLQNNAGCGLVYGGGYAASRSVKAPSAVRPASVRPVRPKMQSGANLECGGLEAASGTLKFDQINGTSSGEFYVQSGANLIFYNSSHTLTVDSSLYGDGNVVFDYAGTIDIYGYFDIWSGSLTIQGYYGPSVNFKPGAWVYFDGPVTISNGTLNLSTGEWQWMPGNLTMTGGTLTGSDSLDIDGTFQFSGGTLSSSSVPHPEVYAYGPFNVDGNDVTVNGRDLFINGYSALWSANNTWTVQNGARIVNYADFNATGGQTMNGNNGGGTFVNAATFSRTGATTTTNIQGVTFNNQPGACIGCSYAPGFLQKRPGVASTSLEGLAVAPLLLGAPSSAGAARNATERRARPARGNSANATRPARRSQALPQAARRAGFGILTTVTDSLFINSGTLKISAGGGQNDGGINVQPGATLWFYNTNYTLAGQTAGGGNVTFDYNGTIDVPGAYSITGTTTVSGYYGPTVNFKPGAVVSFGGPVNISNGNLNLSTGASGGVSWASLNMTGGALIGSDSVTITGLFHFGGGSIASSTVPRPVLTAAAGLTVDGNDVATNGRDLVITGGTAAWPASNNWYVQNGAVVTSNVPFAASGNQTMNGSTGGGTFINGNVFTRTGSTSTTNLQSLTFTNSSTQPGAVTVSSGTLKFNAAGGASSGPMVVQAGAGLWFYNTNYALSGAVSGAGNVTFDYNGTVDISGAFSIGGITTVQGYYGPTANFKAGSTPVFGGQVVISNGSLNLSTGVTGGITLPTLTMSGGSVVGSDNVTVSGLFRFSGGSISSSTIPRPKFTAAGGITVDSNDVAVSGRDLDITGGAAAWPAGNTWYVQNGAVVTSNVPFTASGNQTMNGSTGGGTFVNSNTFTRSGSTTTTTLQNLTFTNSSTQPGAVTISSGTLKFNAAGGSSAGPMVVQASAALWFYNSNYTLTGAVSGAGNVTFDYNGTVDVNGSYNIGGVTTVQGYYGPTANFKAGSTPVFGGQVIISNGTLNLSSGVSGGIPLSSLTMSGGSLVGSDNVTVSGLFRFSGGTISSSNTPRPVLTAAGGLTVDSSDVSVSGRDLVVTSGGALNWPASNTWYVSAGAVVTNQAIFNASAGQTLNCTNGTFVNQGTIIRSGSATTTTVTGGTFNNLAAGTVTISNGTLRLSAVGGINSGAMVSQATGTLWIYNSNYTLGGSVSGAGNVTFDYNGAVDVTGSYAITGITTVSGYYGAAANFRPGAAATFGGPVNVSNGSLNFNTGGTGGISIPSLNLSGGSITGSDAVAVAGAFVWSGGTVAAGGAMNTNGPVSVSANNVALDGRTMNVNAGLTVAGGGSMNVQNGAVLNNAVASTLAVENNQYINVSGSGGQLNNAGTFNATVPTGQTFTMTVPVVNAGSLVASSGTLRVDSYRQNAGTTSLAGGALRSGSSGTGTLDLRGGTLTGAGLITANISNAATVAPGNGSPGILTIGGNYTQTSAGILNIDIAGPSAGQFDGLSMTGTAALSGALNVTLVGGYMPPATSIVFPILGYASKTGSFTTTNIPLLTSGYLVLTTGATQAALTAGNGNPAPAISSITPSSVAAGSAGFWLQVNGYNFVTGSVVRWNTTDLPDCGSVSYGTACSTLVNSTQLTAYIPPASIALAATVPVAVSTPTTGGGGGISTALNLTVLASGGVLNLASNHGSAGGVVHIPVTLNLATTPTLVSLDSISFGVRVTNSAGVPVLTSNLAFVRDPGLPQTTNVDAPSPGLLAVSWVSAATPVFTPALTGTKPLGEVIVTLPATATPGQTYSVQVTNASASLASSAVVLVAGTSQTITLAGNYLVGDASPFTVPASPGNNIGQFGNDTLDNLDLVFTLRQVVLMPGYIAQSCSDRYDAMDSTTNGVVDNLDLIATLDRWAFDPPANWPRRGSRGLYCPAAVNVAGSDEREYQLALSQRGGTAGMPIAGRLEIGAPETTAAGVRVPVYFVPNGDVDLSALSYGLRLTGQAGQFKLRLVRGNAAAPDLSDSALAGKFGVAWLRGLQAAGQPVLLNYVEIPGGDAASAAALSFTNVTANARSDGQAVRIDYPLPGQLNQDRQQ